LFDDEGIHSYCGLSIDQITDGTSTTILCTEMAGRPDYWTRGGKQPLPTRLSGFNPNPGGAWASPNVVPPFVFGSDFTGLNFANCFGPPTCPPVCFFNCTNELGFNASFSFHPGAGGVAMCDGSARMLSEDISVIAFVSLMTPRGREKVTDNF
jgi:hypothetical protein